MYLLWFWFYDSQVKTALISNDLEKHKHKKTNEIKFRRFGEIMTPLSRNGNKCDLLPFPNNGVIMSPKCLNFISLVCT